MAYDRHVALLIETSRSYGRGLLRGIIRYQREHGPWSIYFEPRGINDSAPSWLRSWNGDGILARISNQQTARIIQQCGIPAVDLLAALPELGTPAVGTDNASVVELALGHFLDRGHRRFAFCGYLPGVSRWMDIRRELFLRRVTASGYSCEIFTGSRRRGSRQEWEQDQRQLARWIKSLQRPIAIMACNDDRGLQVLDACRRADIRVPDEVAVLGVDNDEYICGLATPPLSSIDLRLEDIGYNAAKLLDRLMRGGRPPPQASLGPASEVIARQSTDALAIDDVELATAIRYMRENACRGIRLREVTAATGLERRTLERKMKALFGRSPKEELLRIQIEEAKRLLLSTKLSIKAISTRTGFQNSRYFSRVFRCHVGVAPGQFRHRG